jgi:hypothetical protein
VPAAASDPVVAVALLLLLFKKPNLLEYHYDYQTGNFLTINLGKVDSGIQLSETGKNYQSKKYKLQLGS